MAILKDTQINGDLAVINDAAIQGDLVIEGDLTINGRINGENKNSILSWGESITLTELPGLSITARLPLEVPSKISESDTVYLCGSANSDTCVDELQKSSSVYIYEGSELTAETFNATSDARLKENLKLLTVDRSILDLPVYTFDFKEGSKNQIGCLAQDLQKIYPQLVVQNTDGFLSIRESKLIYLLLLELKTLKEDHEALKASYLQLANNLNKDTKSE